MDPYFKTDSGSLFNEDCLNFMRTLPDQSVNCGVTSPPYWGLRDYGETGQLGLEKTPEEYVEKLASVFREFKRVLRDDGTLWLNLGDSYARAGGWANNNGLDGVKRSECKRAISNIPNGQGQSQKLAPGLKPKDLVGIPWRVAFALQADGWYLRQDIIWHKPNPMPESVTDRCTKAHEYIFLLSKSPKYYYDHEAIKEPITSRHSLARYKNNSAKTIWGKSGDFNHCRTDRGRKSHVDLSKGRNKRSVWTVTTKPFKEAHFATFPPDLILPCVLAGCPKHGVVMDMFSGAGTVWLVCEENGRKFIGSELSAEYCEITKNRIEPVASQMRF
jgi:DNA modification methylase